MEGRDRVVGEEADAGEEIEVRGSDRGEGKE